MNLSKSNTFDITGDMLVVYVTAPNCFFRISIRTRYAYSKSTTGISSPHKRQLSLVYDNNYVGWQLSITELLWTDVKNTCQICCQKTSENEVILR